MVSPLHHPTYYLDDNMVIFLVSIATPLSQSESLIFPYKVEDCYFKVHRYFLESFGELFMLPQGGSVPEGDTKERAIPLPGVTRKEFEGLLDVIYEGFVVVEFIIHHAIMIDPLFSLKHAWSDTVFR